jgi:glyoxylase-like metal-dependent hydrolase (beta-lactamase superfamily II)
MSTLTNGATDGTVAIIPENAVADGDEFKISGLTVRVHIMPDVHSGTDAMYELVEDSLVMTGDNVTNQRMPSFRHGTFRGTIKMADMLLGKDFKYFIPGHGPGGDREVIEGFRKYTATVYETAAKLYEEGLSDFEMKDRIVEKLKNYHNWSMFDDQVGRHISLAVLEAEKAAFE